MKKTETVNGWSDHPLKKTFLIMRIIVFLLLTTIFQTYAINAYAQRTRLSLNYNNTELELVLDAIENQSEFFFLYNEKLVDVHRKVTVKANDQAINAILNGLFEGTDVQYSIVDRKIVLAPEDINEAVQQQRSVSGKVTDRAGLPLPGVTVVIKGTTKGTLTNYDGNYSLINIPEDATLVFSFVGMHTEEVVVGNQSSIDLKMVEDIIGIEEVVAIGYGTIKRGEITSSVSNLKSEDFIKGAITVSPVQLIQGKVPGLAIARSDGGDPNSRVSIQLRGVSSVSGNLEPLVIIDGIPGGSLNSLYSDDIESIDVLRDASATAIYGTRGSNGVIIITTKKGKSGQTKVEYSGKVVNDIITKLPDVLTATEYRQMAEDLKASGIPEKITKGFSIVDYGQDTDWFKEITQNPLSHLHNVSISGGNNGTNYSASLNYQNVDGVVKRSNKEVLGSLISLSQTAMDGRLNLSFRLSANTINSTPTDYSVFDQSIKRNPTLPVYNPDGTFYETNVWGEYNPVSIIKDIDRDNQSTHLLGNTSISYEIVPGLTASLMGSMQKNSSLQGYYEHKESTFSRAGGYEGRASRSTTQSVDRILESVISFDKEYNDIHRINMIAGYSYQDFTYEYFNAENSSFLTDLYKYNNIGAGDFLLNGHANMNSGKNSSTLIAFFGRGIYSYKEKYLMTAGFRREGSSKFGENNKWGWFPSISAGWRISNESFMKGIGWLDDLKIRTGYGISGNQGTPPYASLVRLQEGRRMLYNGKWIVGVQPASNPNPDLRWETKRELNLGFDISVLKHRLNASFDVYNNLTKDLIYTYSVPTPPNIYNRTVTNVGEIQNRGIELSLDANPVKRGDFIWNLEFNVSYNKNKLISLSNDIYPFTFSDIGSIGAPGLNDVSVFRLEEGKPIGNMFGYKFAGFSEEGKWLVYNKAGDVIRSNQALYEDKTIIGNGLPRVYSGLNNTFVYKNFDLSVMLRGVFGFDIVNSLGIFHKNQSMLPLNILSSSSDAPLFDSPQYSSYYVEKGDFVKLDNLTLGYSFNVKEGKAFKNARMYVSALNLLTITQFTGMDPELEINGLEPGFDSRWAYPRSTTYTLGINITF